MSVYVDAVRRVDPSTRWRYRTACHMTADTLDELHDMAALLGLRDSWFQPHATFPHYDLTESKRREAIALGAVPEGIVEAVRRMKGAAHDKRP